MKKLNYYFNESKTALNNKKPDFEIRFYTEGHKYPICMKAKELYEILKNQPLFQKEGLVVNYYKAASKRHPYIDIMAYTEDYINCKAEIDKLKNDLEASKYDFEIPANMKQQMKERLAFLEAQLELDIKANRII